VAQTPPRKIAAKKKEVTSPLSSLSIYGKQEMQRIARENSDKRIAEEVLRSPAADTLWEISGGGKPVTAANKTDLTLRIKRITGSDPLGYYQPPFLQKFGDQVVINPTKLNYADNPDKKFDSDIARSIAMQALTHEAGHRADIRRNNAPGENAPFKVPSVDLPPPPRPGKLVQVSPKEYRSETPYDPYGKQRAAQANVDSYYQTSRREGYAQAFATAMSILRNAPRLLQEGQTRDDYANALGKAEAFTPGTGGIVEALLKEKIFQKHPLQQIYKKKTEGR
jgi:hypothetical protein